MTMMTTFHSIDSILKDIGFSSTEIENVKKGHVVKRTPGTGGSSSATASSSLPSVVEPLSDRDLVTAIAFECQGTKDGSSSSSIDTFDHVFLESSTKQESDDTIQQLVTCNNSDDGDNKTTSLDFSSLKLLPSSTASDVTKTYLNFKGGSDLNLSITEIEWFQSLGKHATQAQVEETLQKVLMGRLQDYQQNGLEGISPYHRGGRNAANKDYHPGLELLDKTKKAHVLERMCKPFYDYILNWPHNASKNDDDNNDHYTVEETFGWINYNINNKPSIALYHKVIFKDKQQNMQFLMNRTFYVSMGHNSVQQFGCAVPTSNDSTLLAFSSRTSTDQVTGFGGSAKRIMGSKIMANRIAQNMEKIRELSFQK